MLSGHKGPVYLRPSCIGAAGPRPAYYLSIYLLNIDVYGGHFKQIMPSVDYLYHPLQFRENLRVAVCFARLSQKPAIISLQYINNLLSKLLL
jgi:hypothetical protein